jgi:P27 family predicted phage terminase small subunit
MTEIDVYTLENCCVALSIVRRAAKELIEKNLIFQTKNEDGSLKAVHRTPFLSVWRDALSEFDSNGAKLGLSPSDRVRLRGITKKEEDEFDEFLKTGKAANA